MTTPPDPRSQLVADLLARPVSPQAAADPLRPVLASVLAGRCLQQGVLSATLGLSAAGFEAMCAAYFPGEPLATPDAPARELFELDDLHHLLLRHRAHQHTSEIWLAEIVAHACGGRDHLWQDLGLAHRGELSSLMRLAFPALAALNVHDMKWKKFIYRQYCSMEGIHVCPAPSCGECAERAKCFAPED
ncbi:nitrogen fixation protein NifQ [Rhodoferax sp. 4810]|nr:nitrogen fixation protein NifQ [Rhodoferax jenense]